MNRSTVSLAAVLSLAAGATFADSHGEAALTSYLAAIQTSTDLLPSQSTGDPDVDFLTVLIPQNEATIDLARLVMEQGDDPNVQELARAIIEYREAQNTAIQEMLAAIGTQDGEAPASE